MRGLQLDAPVWDCHTHIFGPWAAFPLSAAPAYRPPLAPFAELQALHQAHGVSRGVIVQAVPYRDDHRALCAALTASAGGYRGVAVIDPDIDETSLQALHTAGVRGIRLGMMRHLAGRPDIGAMRAQLARIQALGWHALVHAAYDDVVSSVPALLDMQVPLLIDHMARASPQWPAPALDPLLELLAQKPVWIKLSGGDRVGGGMSEVPAAVLALMRRLIAAVPERAIWGSDWPHVNISYPSPSFGALLDLLQQACPDQAMLKQILCRNPLRLYDTPSAQTLPGECHVATDTTLS